MNNEQFQIRCRWCGLVFGGNYYTVSHPKTSCKFSGTSLFDDLSSHLVAVGDSHDMPELNKKWKDEHARQVTSN